MKTELRVIETILNSKQSDKIDLIIGEYNEQFVVFGAFVNSKSKVILKNYKNLINENTNYDLKIVWDADEELIESILKSFYMNHLRKNYAR